MDFAFGSFSGEIVALGYSPSKTIAVDRVRKFAVLLSPELDEDHFNLSSHDFAFDAGEKTVSKTPTLTWQREYPASWPFGATDLAPLHKPRHGLCSCDGDRRDATSFGFGFEPRSSSPFLDVELLRVCLFPVFPE